MTDPPLKGIKVLEFAGLAPAPFAGLMLADAGASVLRIDRPSSSSSSSSPQTPSTPSDPLARRKSSITVNLKSPHGRALILSLIPHIDILIDPFRPTVLERLLLGPSTLLSINPRLIYGRLSGFRRDGRYAAMAGHDINYLAVSGVLDMLGRKGERPHAPVNILGDFAGGGAMLVFGLLLALVKRERERGKHEGGGGGGQVVEANMVDGSSYLASFPRMLYAGDGTPQQGRGEGKAALANVRGRGRGENMLDGGAPFYDTYETRDGKFVAVGAVEPQFFSALLHGLNLTSLESTWAHKRNNPLHWPALRTIFEDVFKSKTRSEWEAVFDATDACCTPVLEYAELRQPDPQREGDQRAPVTLSATPCFAACDSEGGGYEGVYLPKGRGGQDVLYEWAGWKRGVEYEVGEDGSLGVKREISPKL